MYRQPHMNQLALGGKLLSDNRWVILAKQIPQAVVETVDAQQFSQEDMGSSAKSSRLVLDVLILKERLGVTDRALVEQIAENPYWQYFLGLMAYQVEAPFHHSLLTTTRPWGKVPVSNGAILAPSPIWLKKACWSPYPPSATANYS